MSLSEISYAGHGLTNWRMYADQEEDDEGHYGSSGGDPEDSQGTHGPVRDGPTSAEAVSAASMALKKALIERALGAPAIA
jgi:hypothetical protein